ncbi:MAG: ABC transporter ATP-binding protein [Alphaproteobacteria bacterium]|nr:ABC transporter ATP-binding protein [Alphaproteobacteria bacterium]
MSEPFIDVRNLSVSYGNRRALQNVTGAFREGSLIAVAGPNGSGKSTLLKALAGVIRPTSGEIVFRQGKRPHMAYLPQVAHIQRDFPISVEEVVLTGFYAELGETRGVQESQRAAARKALSDVGLAGYEARPIKELSGGEFQRMLFARVIVQNAPVILLDEPFTAVDAETTARLIRLLIKWHEEGRTVICILHDLLLIRKYFPESMVLHGKCLGIGHTHRLFEQNLFSFDLDMAELQPVNENPDHPHEH